MRRARSEGPQHVTVHGRDEVVVIAAEEFRRLIRPMFEQRALAVTEDVLFKWRLLVADGRKAGHTYSQPDLIIAETALHNGLTVVSRDTSDFKKARVPVVNPWRETGA